MTYLIFIISSILILLFKKKPAGADFELYRLGIYKKGDIALQKGSEEIKKEIKISIK